MADALDARGGAIRGTGRRLPGGIRALDRAPLPRRRAGRRADRYRRLFDTMRPSVLFCSHQRPPVIAAGPVLAARRAGIPTATFIFSWDN